MEKFEGYNIKLEKSDEKGMISASEIEEYLNIAREATCKIESSNGFGSGFFCKIPNSRNNKNLMNVLITCYHVLEKDLNKKEIIIIVNEKPKSISLEQRKIWKNEEKDFICIEIKEVQDEIKTFFDVDKDIFNHNYLYEKVLIFGINKDEKLGFSNGVIKKREKLSFAHTCNTNAGCSGGCIVKQSNNRVIGIHRGAILTGKEDSLNLGIYIRDIIENLERIKRDEKIEVY